MAEKMGLSLAKLRKISQSIMLEPVSLETSITDDLCLGDYIEDKSCNSPEEHVKDESLKSGLPQLFDELSDRERRVLISRFGLESSEPKTLAQLGDLLGYSKERIRQIEDSAIKKLRNNGKYSCFKDYIEN